MVQVNPEPIIVDITEPPENVAQQVVDVLMGAFGIAGLLFVAGAILGVFLAVFLYWRKSKEDDPLKLT